MIQARFQAMMVVELSGRLLFWLLRHVIKLNKHLQYFLSSLNLQFLTLLAIVGTTTARKITIKSNPDRNAELFQDTKFLFSQDKEDNQEPTIYKGDPMKSKTLVSENVQGKKNFQFA